MSEQALTTAIRAEASAQSAHHRLDRMNGSIDNLAKEVAIAKAEILRRLDRQDGASEATARARASVLDSKWRVLGLAATILASSTFAVIIAFLLRGKH